MNKVELIGRLTRNPEIRYKQGNCPSCVARYTLAVDRRVKREGEPRADFISCVAFGKQAEHAEKYFRRGLKIAVVGRIQTGSYTKDGQKVYTTEVVAEEQEFVESRAASNGGGNSGGYAPEQEGYGPPGDYCPPYQDGGDAGVPWR